MPAARDDPPTGYLKRVEGRRNVWRVQASVGGRGTRRRASATVFGSRAKAEEAYWKLRGKLENDPPPPATTHTVADALDAWWKDRASTHETGSQVAYRADLASLRAAFGTLTLAALDVEAYLDVERSWRRTLRPATIQHRRAVLRGALKHARRLKWLPADPLDLLPPVASTVPPEPARTQASREPLTEDQARTLLAVLAREEWHPWRAFWLVALLGGLRLGEVRGLRRQDVDEAANVLLLRQQITTIGGQHYTKLPKRRKTREAPVPPFVIAAVQEVAASHEHELVFCHEDGSAIGDREARQALYAIEAAAGIPRTAPRGFRSSFATLALAAGVDLAYVSWMLGHASVKITADVYSRYVRKAGRQAAERLGTLLNPDDSQK